MGKDRPRSSQPDGDREHKNRSMKISQAKKLRRTLCSAAGHEKLKNGKCPRCKKLVGVYIESIPVYVGTFPVRKDVEIKYSDIAVKRFNILDRVRERAG